MSIPVNMLFVVLNPRGKLALYEKKADVEMEPTMGLQIALLFIWFDFYDYWNALFNAWSSTQELLFGLFFLSHNAFNLDWVYKCQIPCYAFFALLRCRWITRGDCSSDWIAKSLSKPTHALFNALQLNNCTKPNMHVARLSNQLTAFLDSGHWLL